jgi:hypothetical protein
MNDTIVKRGKTEYKRLVDTDAANVTVGYLNQFLNQEFGFTQ